MHKQPKSIEKLWKLNNSEQHETNWIHRNKLEQALMT